MLKFYLIRVTGKLYFPQKTENGTVDNLGTSVSSSKRRNVRSINGRLLLGKQIPWSQVQTTTVTILF